MSALDTIARLERSLAASTTQPEPVRAGMRAAAVAAIFRIAENDALELLFIERASYEGDPWSGHIAFPGGRREPADSSDLDTAIRETREELGLDIRTSGRVIGALSRLNPMSPSLPPLSIAPFVAVVELDRAGELRLSDEVANAFWIPLATLQLADASRDVEVRVGGGTRNVRAFVHEGYTIWGLTERIIRDLLARIE